MAPAITDPPEPATDVSVLVKIAGQWYIRIQCELGLCTYIQRVLGVSYYAYRAPSRWRPEFFPVGVDPYICPHKTGWACVSLLGGLVRGARGSERKLISHPADPA